jgi:hypothetical protein
MLGGMPILLDRLGGEPMLAFEIVPAFAVL